MKKNEIVPFGYDDQLVRTVLIDDTPWFVAKDVCAALGLSDVSMSVSKLDDDEKLVQKIFVSGQNRDMVIINESGLYTLILRSNKPEAKKFRKWVTSEVLPSIRKNGVYDIAGTINDRLERIENILLGLTTELADIKKGQLQISAQPEITDPKTAMLYFGGKFLEITGKDGDYVEVQTLFKIFKGMFKVEIDSRKFMYELPLAFPEIRLDTRCRYKALFRGCVIK